MNNLFEWAEEYLKVVDKLWEMESYEEGMKVLESVLIEEPGFAKAHSYAGWYAHYHLKDKKNARMHYEYALHFDPKLTYAYYNYAKLLVEDIDESRMKRLLTAGLKFPEVDKADLYNDLGRILELKNNYAAAAKYFKLALKFTVNEYVLRNIKGNRKRVISKKRLFGAWYSWLL